MSGFCFLVPQQDRKEVLTTRQGVLALVFGVNKFHKYVYGRPIEIWTDHKPLVGLLQEGKLVPPMASSRMQWWPLKLAAYNYMLQYWPGTENGI